MHHLHTQIDIAAPVERVWALLADFPSYSRWNPQVRSVEGNLGVGQALKIFVEPPGARGVRLRPTLLAVEPNRELRWKWSVLVPGLLEGEHYFELKAKSCGGLTFHHGEIFSGILVPLLGRQMNGVIKQGFVAANDALKRQAEGR
jgi:hypothetical protein